MGTVRLSRIFTPRFILAFLKKEHFRTSSSQVEKAKDILNTKVTKTRVACVEQVQLQKISNFLVFHLGCLFYYGSENMKPDDQFSNTIS